MQELKKDWSLKVILLISALFVGMNTSYANNAKVKKIKYDPTIFYIGEAVKTDEGWQPKGKGVLYEFMSSFKFTIEGTFDGEKVIDACMKIGNISPKEEIPSTEAVFKGVLSYTIPNSSKTEYAYTHITFTSGEFTLKSPDGPISIVTPFEFNFAVVSNARETWKTLCLGKSRDIDKLFDIEKVDILRLYANKPYKALVSGGLYLHEDVFEPYEGIGLVWEDGTSIQVDKNRNKIIRYPHLNTSIFLRFSRTEFFTNEYSARYHCVLKDGTSIFGNEENFDSKRMWIDFGDTYYEGSFKIQGINSFKELALGCNELTKEDISFDSGILVRGKTPWKEGSETFSREEPRYPESDAIIEEYVNGKTLAQREAEEEARVLAVKKAQEERDAKEKAQREAEEKARKQKLINKYGTRYANAILNSEPLIGMTLEMLQEMNYEIEIWGIMRSVSWQRTSKTNYNGVVIEHWEFEGHSVTLKNGKVIEINETL